MNTEVTEAIYCIALAECRTLVDFCHVSVKVLLHALEADLTRPAHWEPPTLYADHQNKTPAMLAPFDGDTTP